MVNFSVYEILTTTFCILACPAFRFDNSDILLGWPYGGCAILWRSDIYANVKIIHTNCRRICVLRFTNGTLRLLLVNVYMPYEGKDVITE